MIWQAGVWVASFAVCGKVLQRNEIRHTTRAYTFELHDVVHSKTDKDFWSKFNVWCPIYFYPLLKKFEAWLQWVPDVMVLVNCAIACVAVLIGHPTRVLGNLFLIHGALCW